MKNINEYLNEGFFSNVGGSLSYFKKLLIPIFELNNPDRKKIPNTNVIDDILAKLPEKFGFNIYKYLFLSGLFISNIGARSFVILLKLPPTLEKKPSFKYSFIFFISYILILQVRTRSQYHYI